MNRTVAVRWLCACALVWAGSILFAAPSSRPSSQPATQSPPQTPQQSLAIERRYLSPEDIQKIRRGELRSDDTARVQISQETRRDYAASRGISFSEFTAKPAIDQALDILDNGDASMQSRVRVMSDPQALIEYKKIQPMILTGCAAIGCHGGMNGGSFLLFPSESEPATYTNFYILTQFASRASKPGGGIFDGMAERKLIERGHGDQSLLAQFSLPASKVQIAHPRVPGYKPIFNDPQDARYRKLVDWMNISLRPIEPQYGIDYVLPRGRNAEPLPTSKPATNPSRSASTKPTSSPATKPSTTKPSTTKPAAPPHPR